MNDKEKHEVYINLKKNILNHYINDSEKLTKKQLKKETYLKFFSKNVKEIVSLALKFMFCFLGMFFLLAVFTYFFAPQEAQNKSGWNGIIKSIETFLLFYVPYKVCFSTLGFFYKKESFVVNEKIKTTVIKSTLEYLENNKDKMDTFAIDELFKYKNNKSSDFFEYLHDDVLTDIKKKDFLSQKKLNNELTYQEKLSLIKSK